MHKLLNGSHCSYSQGHYITVYCILHTKWHVINLFFIFTNHFSLLNFISIFQWLHTRRNVFICCKYRILMSIMTLRDVHHGRFHLSIIIGLVWHSYPTTCIFQRIVRDRIEFRFSYWHKISMHEVIDIRNKILNAINREWKSIFVGFLANHVLHC